MRNNELREESPSAGALSSSSSFVRRGYRPGTASTFPRPADHAEWLELRRPFFNASATATLFGEHPFLDLADVVRSKLEHLDGDENAAMRRGTFLEPAIADWWSDEHGIALVEPEVLYARGPLMATLDRVPVGSTTDAVEIKSTAKYVSRPERYWWWQCQAQCWCAGLERVHLAVLDASMSLATYVVERDDEAIGRMVERATEVMAHVSAGRWPPSVPTERPQRHTDRVVELDAEAVEHLEAWLAVREQLHDLESLEAEHKAALVDVLGDAQAATVDGRQVLTYRSHTRTNIDLARLRAEHADLAAELSVAQIVRVLRPVGR